MKKIFKTLILLIFCLSIILVSCSNASSQQEQEKPSEDPTPITKEVKRILNADGSYGGSFNKELYGEGTPLNGEADVVDSDYFIAPDIYNLTSTDQRTLLSNYETYQQTMADSDGIACILMQMHRDKLLGGLTEKDLVDKYEELNNTTIYGNGTTANGLKKVLQYYGYSHIEIDDFVMSGSTRNQKSQCVADWILTNLESNYTMLVKIQYGLESNWKVIIGLDRMKDNTVLQDDVVIMADPNDVLDHKQDGYTWVPIPQLFAWWMDAQPSGAQIDVYNCVVFKNKINNPISRVAETRIQSQEVPALHLLLNEDGSYGGSYNSALYGTISEKNGTNDNLDSNYYKFVDVYAMEQTPDKTIKVLPEYRAFQQTMASTCGLCSLMSIANFYGYQVSQNSSNKWSEISLLNNFERVTGAVVLNSGIGSVNAVKMLQASPYNIKDAVSKRYTSYAGPQSKVYPTYESFAEFISDRLANYKPLAVSWKPVGGHWEVIIGFDDMGTPTIYDDVIILADSHDVYDHYQDGYNIYNATVFYGRWFNGSHSTNQQQVIWG